MGDRSLEEQEGKDGFREHVNVVVPCFHNEHPDSCMVEDLAKLRADVCALDNQLSSLWLRNENISFFVFFSLDAAWPGQDRSCIDSTAKIKEHELSHDIVCCCKCCAPYLHSLVLKY